MREPIFILMRGLGRELGHWDRFPKSLNDHFEKCQIVELDMPGVGSFADQSSPFRIQQHVALMRERLIEKLGGPAVYEEICGHKRLHFVGLSLGGMIAIQWSVEHPGDVASLTLMNTSTARYSLPWKRLRPKASQLLLVEWPTLKDDHEREKKLVNLLTHDSERFEYLTEQWALIARDRPVSYVNLSRQMAAAVSFFGPSKLSVPALLLVSARDQMVHPDCSRVLRKKWGINLYEHSWAGHDIICDDPNWVSQKMRTFLSELNLLETKSGVTHD